MRCEITAPWEDELASELARLHEDGLGRQLQLVGQVDGATIHLNGQPLRNFASNNYLGLAHHPALRAAAAEAAQQWGSGATASQLVCGHLGIHHQLASELAKFKQTEACVLFPSGYMAALGVVCSLVAQDDMVLLDRLSHACLIDAARLSGATLRVYDHNDPDSLQAALQRASNRRRVLVITEGLFSMDGDISPLDKILEVVSAAPNARLLVDDAHATGVLGSRGAGSVDHFLLATDQILQMGTLSKALGSLGGYLAASQTVIDWIVHTARPFIYTTAPAPAAAGAALCALRMVQTQPSLRRQLQTNTERLRAGLTELGFDVGEDATPIIPLQLGAPETAVAWSQYLRARGIYAPAMRPPTVPRGTSRLRLSCTAAHSNEDIDILLSALSECREDDPA